MDKIKISKKEGRSIFFHVFMGCLLAALTAIITVCLSVVKSRREEAQDMEQIMNTIHAYLSESTEEEYNEIAEEIRQDLVLGKYYAEDKLKYIDYIPNTADRCAAEEYRSTILLSLNTASAYELDFSEEEGPNGLSVSWGYDEVSETGIQIVTNSADRNKCIEIDSKRGIVSVQRMKALFCDDCINKILTANENTPLPELVFYDGETEDFYPVVNGEEYQLGGCQVKILYQEDGCYEITAAR
mgnify:CR=1 FL=1